MDPPNHSNEAALALINTWNRPLKWRFLLTNSTKSYQTKQFFKRKWQAKLYTLQVSFTTLIFKYLKIRADDVIDDVNATSMACDQPTKKKREEKTTHAILVVATASKKQI